MFRKKKKRLMLEHILDDNKQIARMKELALNPVYSCSGEMYKLLSYEVMHKLVKKIKKGVVHLSNDLIYGRDIITKEEKFLENLNMYIGYVKDNYFIEHMEQLYIIELSLSNKYSDILLSTLEYTKDKNYEYYEDQFRKMFIYNLYENILFLGEFASVNSYIKQFISKFKNINFDSIDDSIKLEKFIKKIISKKNYCIFNSFIPFKEYNDKTFDFYYSQVNDLLSLYFVN